MWLLRWLPRCCYVVAVVFWVVTRVLLYVCYDCCQSVAFRLLKFSWRLLGCCYVVVRMLWVVAKCSECFFCMLLW